MSLYDDLDVPSDEGDKPTSVFAKPAEPAFKPQPKEPPKPAVTQPAFTPGLSFLKSQLDARKAQAQAPKLKPSNLISVARPNLTTNTLTNTTAGSGFIGHQSTRQPAPVLRAKRIVQPLKVDASASFNILPKTVAEDKICLFNEIMVDDEYNPTAPTNYETYKPVREVTVARERASREAIERVERELAEEEAKRSAGAAFAPPSVLLEDNTPAVEVEDEKEDATASTSGTNRGPIAANIMARMGYREGSGLGKNEQGISAALSMKKTGKYGGVIINASRGPLVDVDDPDEAETTDAKNAVSTNGDAPLPIGPQVVPAPSSLSSINVAPTPLPPRPVAPTAVGPDGHPPPVNIAEILRNASKVVLVRNMVTPNDVDPELKAEVGEEMRKYGQVSEVVIHVIPGAPVDQAVRIFIEFTNQAQAIKAVIDLNKRFFGGRAIRARFYEADEFAARNYTKPV